MKRILVAYATREGHTEAIADHIAERLLLQGHRVTTMNVADADPFEDGPNRFDCAIFAASIHMGKHEPEMVTFVQAHLRELGETPAAFLSVSLSETTAEDPSAPDDKRQKAKRDVAHAIEHFIEETGWVPSRTKPIAGALAYTRYGFIVRFMMKQIARAAGASTDTSCDHVYTNWRVLDAFVDELVATAALSRDTLGSPLPDESPRRRFVKTAGVD
ncbi:MAG: protoporphyrinogen oxidase [Polyangiaceae bacterium]|nr:protoporphyrinogen oxidase [Polyangiaceae bacterium]